MSQQQKTVEVACLEKTIEHGKKSPYRSAQNIIKLLEGRNVHRKYEERPDFVKRIKLPPGSGKETIVGIEHFRVDHLTLKKQNGKIVSTGAKHENEKNKVRDKWVGKVDDNNIKNASEDTYKMIAGQFKALSEATYPTFLASFEHSLDKHVKKIPEYRRNMGEIAAKDENIKLVFLIEIYTCFSYHFFNDTKGFHQNTSGLMPMFTDVVKLLEKTLNQKRVDYIILCSRNIIDNKHTQIIALKTGKLKTQLKKQNVNIYEYAGEDYLLKSLQPIQKVEVKPFCSDNGKNNLTFEISEERINDTDMAYFTFFALKKAYTTFQNNKNFVTTLHVQELLYMYGESIIGWKPLFIIEKTSNVKPVINALDQKNIALRQQVFNKEYIEPIKKRIDEPFR